MSDWDCCTSSELFLYYSQPEGLANATTHPRWGELSSFRGHWIEYVAENRPAEITAHYLSTPLTFSSRGNIHILQSYPHISGAGLLSRCSDRKQPYSATC